MERKFCYIFIYLWTLVVKSLIACCNPYDHRSQVSSKRLGRNDGSPWVGEIKQIFVDERKGKPKQEYQIGRRREEWSDMNPISEIAWVVRNLRLDSHGPNGKPNTIVLLNNKMTPNGVFLQSQISVSTQSSAEVLPPAAFENK